MVIAVAVFLIGLLTSLLIEMGNETVEIYWPNILMGIGMLIFTVTLSIAVWWKAIFLPQKPAVELSMTVATTAYCICLAVMSGLSAIDPYPLQVVKFWDYLGYDLLGILGSWPFWSLLILGEAGLLISKVWKHKIWEK